MLLLLANQLLSKLLRRGWCWCLPDPVSDSRLCPEVPRVAYPVCRSGRAAGLGEGHSSSACPGCSHRLHSGRFGFTHIAGWGSGKTSWAKSTAVGSRLSLLPAFFHHSSICCSDVLRRHAPVICLGQLNCQVNGE